MSGRQAIGPALNIETKVEASAPERTAPREVFVRRVYEEIRASGIEHQVTIQSFDWAALKAMHRLVRRRCLPEGSGVPAGPTYPPRTRVTRGRAC